MVEYECERCKKKFSHKNDYEKHQNRKTLCKKVPEKNDQEQVVLMLSAITEKLQCIDKMQDTIDCLTKEIEILKSDSINNKSNVSKEPDNYCTVNGTIANTVNNNIINNTVNNNIVISFGKETDDFLTDENIKEVLLSRASVQKYIKLVYCNNNKPENKNIYISNSRDMNGSIYVLVDTQWELSTNKIIDLLRSKGIDFVCRNYNDYEEKFNKQKNDNSELKMINALGIKFKKCLGDDVNNKFRNNISEEIKIALFNNKPKKSKR